MFMQAEAVERSFCYVVIKRNFTIIQEPFQCLFLIDTVVNSFQYFPFGIEPLLPMQRKPLPVV